MKNKAEQKLIRLWYSINHRCYNPKQDNYTMYGGRDITVCEKWDRAEFIKYCKTLKEWDNPDLTLDRIDNDGNYEPGNLRFIDRHYQLCNRRMMKNNKTGYIGIRWSKTNKKYIGSVGLRGKLYNMSGRDTIQEALELRNQFIINNNLVEYAIQ